MNSSPINIESCGLQSVEEKLFLSVATMLDTKYRDAFDQPLLGIIKCFVHTFSTVEGIKEKKTVGGPLVRIGSSPASVSKLLKCFPT